MFSDLVKEIIQKVQSLAQGTRFILGVTGVPAAGKSTFAANLVEAVNEKFPETKPAIVVPMDGFHYSNAQLQQMNLLHLKGIPDSFDADSFVRLIKRLRTDTTERIAAPLFDRSIEASIEGGIEINPAHALCVVEGNYLLLPHSPWSALRQYFDQVWFLEVPLEVVQPRLMARHLAARSRPEALIKIESTDLPNALLISDTKMLADRVILQTELKSK